jgi:4-carboxymuconolactone decarboxylase
MSSAPKSEKPLRIPLLTMDQLDARQKQCIEDPVYRKVMATGQGLTGQAGFLLHSPGMWEGYIKLGEYVKCDSSLPSRLKEMTILIAARLWTAQYLWTAHLDLAQKAGLADAIIADLRDGRRPASAAADEAAVYDYCIELAQRHAVSDTTFKRASGFLDHRQIIDLTAVLGYYFMVSMFVNANELPARDNGVPPLAPVANPFAQ